MAYKTFLAVICSLLISTSAIAQNNSGGGSTGQGSQSMQVVQNQVNAVRSWWASFFPARPVTPRPVPVVRAVPELDGNMAFLALGLTLAVGALVREKRRKA